MVKKSTNNTTNYDIYIWILVAVALLAGLLFFLNETRKEKNNEEYTNRLVSSDQRTAMAARVRAEAEERAKALQAQTASRVVASQSLPNIRQQQRPTNERTAMAARVRAEAEERAKALQTQTASREVAIQSLPNIRQQQRPTSQRQRV